MSFIAYKNIADSAIITAPDGTAVGYPIANVKLRESDKFARLIDGGPTSRMIVMDFGAPVLPRFIGLFGLNSTEMTTSMISVVQGSDNLLAWSNPALDVWTSADQGSPLPADAKVLLSRVNTARRYWRVNAFWPRPAGQTYFQVARLWVSDARGMFEADDGLDPNWSHGAVDHSLADELPSGMVFAQRRALVRSFNFSVSGQTQKKVYGFDVGDSSGPSAPSAQEALFTAGYTGEVVVATRSGSPIWMHRTCVRGRLPNGLSIAAQGGGYYAVSGAVREER